MIDNIILLITGTLHQRPITELVPKCHPLGSFEEMASINIASTPAELYNAVMIDTPLGWSKHHYFIIKLHFLWRVFPFQGKLAPVKASLNSRPQFSKGGERYPPDKFLSSGYCNWFFSTRQWFISHFYFSHGWKFIFIYLSLIMSPCDAVFYRLSFVISLFIMDPCSFKTENKK